MTSTLYLDYQYPFLKMKRVPESSTRQYRVQLPGSSSLCFQYSHVSSQVRFRFPKKDLCLVLKQSLMKQSCLGPYPSFTLVAIQIPIVCIYPSLLNRVKRSKASKWPTQIIILRLVSVLLDHRKWSSPSLLSTV